MLIYFFPNYFRKSGEKWVSTEIMRETFITFRIGSLPPKSGQLACL